MIQEAEVLEKQALEALAKDNFGEAYDLFAKAAKVYAREKTSQKAVFCHASAASCWSKKSGEQTFWNAAKSYLEAAKLAEKIQDFGYASILYKYAAINFERERDLISFSDCFYLSKECQRKYLYSQLFGGSKSSSFMEMEQEKGIKGALIRIVSWIYLNVSFVVWGHGERPQRTIFCALMIIALAALLYPLGHLQSHAGIIHPNLLQSLYFSIVTYTTVGYGDYAPVGWTRLVVMFEAFAGIFIMPLFFISLTRKYLQF